MTDKNTIYKSYKQRLISINSRNSSFFLGKLNSKRHIDLVSIANEFNKREDVYDKLLLTKTIKLKRLIVNENDLINVINKQDANYRNLARNILPQLKEKDFAGFELLINEKNSESELNLHIRKVIKNYETKNNQIFNDFATLTKSITAKRRETGKADLYLGFPFIEGKIESKDFRAPLVLHRINIKQTGNTISIEILNEGRMINPVFLLSYMNQNQKDHKRLDFELPETNNFNYIKYAMKFLKDEGINLTYNDHNLSEIESLTKREYKEKTFNARNAFKIINNAVIGMFPISNQNIYNDIDYLDKYPAETSKSLNNFLSGIMEYKDKDEYPPRESDIKYITPLDWSQRLVVKNAIDNDLVIEGPPGTGKSQTIVNIIVNLLLQDKSVLVISEKVAAIEVVYNRLGILRENALIIKDPIRNKNDFFNQISLTSDNLEGNFQPKYNNKYDIEIDRYLCALKEINKSNFYNEFSYEDVLSLSKYKDLVSYGESKESITKLIDKTKKQLLNIKYETTSILNKEIIDSYKTYLTQKDLDLFALLSEEELSFFANEFNLGHTYEQTQYNYYLFKLNENVIKHKFITKNNIDLSFEHTLNYYEFTNYVASLYEKYLANKDYIKQYSNHLYDNLNDDLTLINLAINWVDISIKEKNALILSLYKNKKRRKCFINIFKKKQLSEEQVILKDYLDNYSNNFDLELLRSIYNNLTKEELILFRAINNKDISSKDDLISYLLSSGIIKFNDVNFDNSYNLFVEFKEKIDYDSINKINALSDSEINLIEDYLSSNLTYSKFVNVVLVTYIGLEKLNEALKINKYLKDNKKAYDKALSNMESKYTESLNYTYDYVKRQINDEFKVNSLLYDSYTNLVNQTTQKRKLSVRAMFKRYEEAIRTIYPVILTTPDVLSSIFPLDQDLFDYVIFDEASQMFVERAVPAIQRSKSVVVAGDSQQLKPSSVFTSRFTESDELEDDDTLTNAELEALDKESLLDLAKGKYQSSMLKVHYRSKYEELIEFSSRAFYNNELFFASKLNDKDIYHRPIEVIDVIGGLWSSDNTNTIEAIEVVRIIKEVLGQRTSNETIGVITFNIKQRNLITNLLEQENNSNINKELDRINIQTLEDESLFVKNIENVQGDERDIIIFSIGYARDLNGNISARFGTLNQSGGENRLNVAITRAKKKIYVIKSIKARELNINVDNPGPLRLKQYLQYVELLSENNMIGRKDLLNSIYQDKHSLGNKKNIEQSLFHNEVHEELIKTISNSHLIRRNIYIGDYVIDFAIYHKQTNKYVLGIKCDEYKWSLNPIDREKDFHQEQYLEQRGWYLHKILETNWNKDDKNEMNKVRTAFEVAIDKFNY